jgi:hypothetical protein
MRCRGVQGVANAAYLEGFPFPALLSVAPYCAPGGVRVVSREALLLHVLLSRSTDPKLVQFLLGHHASIQLTLDRHSHWIPSVGGATAVRLDEASG